MEIRILVSSRNSSDLFDLRCLVREKILAFVRDRYPEALPSTRVEFARPATAGGEAEAPAIPAAAGAR